MDINPYLNFNGDCAMAFKFYQKVLGGKIVMMQTHGESPLKDQVPASWHDKIVHARLEIDGKALMGSDVPPERYGAPHGMYVSVSFAEPAEGERVFNALSEGGKGIMPYQKTFWSPGFGMTFDRFGIPWMVNSGPA